VKQEYRPTPKELLKDSVF